MVADDERLVKTAVISHARSFRAVNLPRETEAARRIRDRYVNDFWCGVYLGGCGQPLVTKLGNGGVVPHFAHPPSREDSGLQCRRQHQTEGSADHLHVAQGLMRWLKKLGYEMADPTFRGDFDTGGTCTDLTVQLVNGDRIEVAFRGVDLESWLDRVMREIPDSACTLMFGPGLVPPAHVVHNFGYAIQLRLEEAALEPDLVVRTQTVNQPTIGASLSQCDFREGRVRTPSQPQSNLSAGSSSSSLDDGFGGRRFEFVDRSADFSGATEVSQRHNAPFADTSDNTHRLPHVSRRRLSEIRQTYGANEPHVYVTGLGHVPISGVLACITVLANSWMLKHNEAKSAIYWKLRSDLTHERISAIRAQDYSRQVIQAIVEQYKALYDTQQRIEKRRRTEADASALPRQPQAEAGRRLSMETSNPSSVNDHRARKSSATRKKRAPNRRRERGTHASIKQPSQKPDRIFLRPKLPYRDRARVERFQAPYTTKMNDNGAFLETRRRRC